VLHRDLLDVAEGGTKVAAKDILLLGDPRLYAASEPVRQADIPSLGAVIRDLHDTLAAYRAKQGAGRAIAAPQIGVPKRIVYVHTGTPLVLLNPALVPASDETMEIWDRREVVPPQEPVSQDRPSASFLARCQR
jgi:hypothetical protein